MELRFEKNKGITLIALVVSIIVLIILAGVSISTLTGENGIYNTKSTGMGLYIAKKLCDKLGHKIEITSLASEYTLVTLTFGVNNYYKIQTNITKL